MQDPFQKAEVKVAVLGGGTGSFTILSALKKYTKQIAAIVSMADDGGSTGVLRDELGALPPGDVRQCLVALSDSEKVRDLFEYRFDAGTFSGHSFGNILLTALEKITGDFRQGVETASEILRIKGTVIPATLEDVRLKMEWKNKSVVLNGERVIDNEIFKYNPKKAKVSLVPEPKANPVAIKAIKDADIVIIAPGDLYTSLGALLIIKGIGDALRATDAKVFYVANLVSKQGQTDGFTVSDHAGEIERLSGGQVLDYVVYNNKQPSKSIAKRYRDEGGYVTPIDIDKMEKMAYKAIGGDFIGDMVSKNKADTLIKKRSLIRHNADALIKVILDIYERDK